MSTTLSILTIIAFILAAIVIFKLIRQFLKLKQEDASLHKNKIRVADCVSFAFSEQGKMLSKSTLETYKNLKMSGTKVIPIHDHHIFKVEVETNSYDNIATY